MRGSPACGIAFCSTATPPSCCSTPRRSIPSGARSSQRTARRTARQLSLRPIDALAELAAEAWLLLHAYRGRGRLQAAVSNTDTRAFARWAGEFERRSARSQFITEAQLPEALRAAFAASRLTPPTGLLLAGFDSKTPAQTALLDAIAATGTPIEELDPQNQGAPSIAASSQWVGRIDREPDATPSLALVAATDERAELTACARWLRDRLTRATRRPHRRHRLPPWRPWRAEIDRVFRQTLAPELNAIAAPASSGPYEFSLGVPLAHTPTVAAALDILRWGPAASARPRRARFCSRPTSPRAVRNPQQQSASPTPNFSPAPSSTPSSCANSICSNHRSRSTNSTRWSQRRNQAVV